MSKEIRFTTIEIIRILASLTVMFPTLAFMSTTTYFIPLLPYLGPLPLLLLYLESYAAHILYESLVYRLLSVKLIFFKLDMTSNIIKCLDVVIVGKVNKHVFSIA